MRSKFKGQTTVFLTLNDDDHIRQHLLENPLLGKYQTLYTLWYILGNMGNEVKDQVSNKLVNVLVIFACEI